MGKYDDYPDTYAGLLVEVRRLRKISERQSANLAQALKEKNDLATRVTALDAAHYTDQIKRLQGDLTAVREQLNRIRNAAKEFSSAIKGY